MTPRRIACVSIVDFSLVVAADDRQQRQCCPCAVAESDSQTAVVVAVNQIAARDVSVGMTVAQAKTRCSELHLLIRHTGREHEASQQLLSRLQHVGPTVELAGPGRFFLDIRGLSRLLRDETGVAGKIKRVLEDTPFRAQIGIAGNKLVAWVASLTATIDTVTIVPPATEREFVAPLPISVLPLSVETKEKLYTLGLNCVRDLAQLPPNEITVRFGHDVLALAQYVRGDDPSLFIPETLPEELTESIHLDFPLTNVAQLCTHIDHLLQRLLQSPGGGLRELRLRFTGKGMEPMTLRIGLDTATASRSIWMRQVAATMERQKLAGPVSDIQVTLGEVVAVVPDQLPIPGCGRDSRADGAQTVERELLPIRSIGLRPSLLPEQGFFMTDHGSPNRKYGDLLSPRYTVHGIAGLRLYRPPRKVPVTTGNGAVLSVAAARVTAQAGPWYLSGEWWDRAFYRWYYDVETEGGDTFLLFYDALRSQWFLHGIFD